MLDTSDTRVETVRARVLEALDTAAAELYGEGVLGATDSELPALFKALDAQANRLCGRAVEVRIKRENERNAAFRACPILADYLSTALQDLQLYEADEACEDEREARDSGTIYTLPDDGFKAAQSFCVAFMDEHRAAIDEALALVPGEEGLRYARGDGFSYGRIGSTLYLASVGHGVTFTDDGDAPCLQSLAEAARDLRRESPYFGDDGRVYGFTS